MKIIIPMAGRGSRFQAVAYQNPEYKKPKPLIQIFGEPMIQWALKSLPFIDLPKRPANTSFTVKPSDLVFISLEQQEEEYGITGLMKGVFGKDINYLLIPEVTRGALETAIKAKEFMGDEEIIISDSDHYFDGENLYKAILEKDTETAGIIPVFRPSDQDPKWSFTLFDKDQIASAVGEKDAALAAKGAYANIGAYYFSKGEIFKNAAEEIINSEEMFGPEGKKEFYVAPIYDWLIKKGMKVKTAIIPEVWGLGTPKDLEYFLANYKVS